MTQQAAIRALANHISHALPRSVSPQTTLVTVTLAELQAWQEQLLWLKANQTEGSKE